MDVNVWQGLINNLGFPVVMVGACAWLIFYMYKAQLADKERLYEELTKSTAANEKFADIINTYTSKLESIQVDVKDIKVKVGA